MNAIKNHAAAERAERKIERLKDQAATASLRGQFRDATRLRRAALALGRELADFAQLSPGDRAAYVRKLEWGTQ